MMRCRVGVILLGDRVTWPRTPILLALLLLAAPALAGDAQELAQAVRCYYDEGAEPASRQLLGLLERLPDRDDAAWWLARCQLDLGQPESALASLEGRDGENLPSWRFPALEAQAALLAGQTERAAELVEDALAASPSEAMREGLFVELRWIAAGLAVRRGDHAVAVLHLLALGRAPEPSIAIRAALPELGTSLLAPLAPGASLPGPLLLEAVGRWWSLPAGGGLALAVAAPSAGVQECPGPDLCTPSGAPLLPQPGIRHTPSLVGHRVLYSAGREPLDAAPEAPGLFSWSPGHAPLRLSRAPEGAQDLHPVAGPDDLVFFLRVTGGQTSLMRLQPGEEPQVLAPDLTAVASVAVVGDRVVVAAVQDGGCSLRTLPVDAAPEQASVALLAVPLEVWSLRSP